ncbi:MAG: helix-turn-helix domain-containing protein [Candidatus Binatota bacterium]
MEMNYIKEVLDACGGNKAKAAEILGVSPSTLWRRLQEEA